MISSGVSHPALLSSDAQGTQNLDILLKNQDQAFVAKTVLIVDVAKDGNQAGIRHIKIFDISLPWYYWGDLFAFEAG